MRDLSIIIPARNEMFLARTVQSILENIEGDTEIIAICDGYWPIPVIIDHPRIDIIHHTTPVGQRRGTNEGLHLSRAKFVMKADAHCHFDKGFDVKLMQNCEYDWTVIPRMYNLHAFDWECPNCKNRTYQGPKPTVCDVCKKPGEFKMEMVWKIRKRKLTDFARFDENLHFQYWPGYHERPEAQGDIADVMCSVGACWLMHRERFLELDGLDEGHGSWGQVGVELACKTWLSGGRQVVNKNTWFSHLFRTQQGGGFGFPYKIHGSDQERAREYSRRLWLGNRWEKAKLPFRSIIEKFNPVPGWSLDDDTLI